MHQTDKIYLMKKYPPIKGESEYPPIKGESGWVGQLG